MHKQHKVQSLEDEASEQILYLSASLFILLVFARDYVFLSSHATVFQSKQLIQSV